MSVEGVSGRGMMLERTLEADGDRTRIARIRSSVWTSASDDYTSIAAEQAKVRLELEREEILKRIKDKVEARRQEEEVSEGYGSEESKYSVQDEEEGGKEEERVTMRR